MTFTRAIYASTLAAGVGLAGLFGVGLGTASADPWGPTSTRPARRDATITTTIRTAIDGGPAPVDWQQRGIDEGRGDHQPFNGTASR